MLFGSNRATERLPDAYERCLSATERLPDAEDRCWDSRERCWDATERLPAHAIFVEVPQNVSQRQKIVVGMQQNRS